MKFKFIHPMRMVLSAAILLALASCYFLEDSRSANNTNGLSSSSPLISQKNLPSTKAYKIITITEGLERPWGMTWLPDGSILITERPGRLRRKQR